MMHKNPWIRPVKAHVNRRQRARRVRNKTPTRETTPHPRAAKASVRVRRKALLLRRNWVRHRTSHRRNWIRHHRAHLPIHRQSAMAQKANRVLVRFQTRRNANQRNANQRNANQRNANQRNANRRNANRRNASRNNAQRHNAQRHNAQHQIAQRRRVRPSRASFAKPKLCRARE